MVGGLVAGGSVVGGLVVEWLVMGLLCLQSLDQGNCILRSGIVSHNNLHHPNCKQRCYLHHHTNYLDTNWEIHSQLMAVLWLWPWVKNL